MDVATELASLDADIDDTNIFEELATPPPSGSPHIGLTRTIASLLDEQEKQEVEYSSTVENSLSNDISNYQQVSPQLPDNLSPSELQDLVEAAASNYEAHTSEFIASLFKQATATDANAQNQETPSDGVDDLIMLPQLPVYPVSSLFETQSNRISSLDLGLISQASLSSIGAQDMAGMTFINQTQNQDLLMLQGTGTHNENSTNHELLMQNTIANNSFSGINYQQLSSFPSLFRQNPVEAQAGIGTGITNGRQFMSKQSSALFPYQNLINNPHRRWNTRWPQLNRFPAANAYGSQYASNYLQPRQSTNLLHQVSHHAYGMQSIFNRHYPTYPRSEPYSYPQSALAPLPPNRYNHGRGYRSMLPHLALSSGPSMYHNYNPLSRPFATTYNSFGSRSSMPPRNPQFSDNQNYHYHTNLMMPIGCGQQGAGSVQLTGSLRVSDRRIYDYNQFSTTSSTLDGPATLSRFAGSQLLSSRVSDPSGGYTLPQATNSLLFNLTAPEFSPVSGFQNASGVQLQNILTLVFADSSSSSGGEAGEDFLALLNLDAQPSLASSSPPTDPHPTQNVNSPNQHGIWIGDLQNELSRNEADTTPEKSEEGQESPCRGRIRKRLEVGESSSSLKRPKEDSDTTQSQGAELSPDSQEGEITTENEGEEDQNADATNSFPGRPFMNSVYDPAFERIGLPIDPHLRFFFRHGN